MGDVDIIARNRITDLINSQPVNVQEYHAPNGGDDTIAIDKAFAAANSTPGTSRAVYFPGSNTPYFYNGAGQNYSNMSVIGDGNYQSIITLGAGLYLIDANQQFNAFYFGGLQIQGGAGAIRNRWTGTNVDEPKIVEFCVFYNFTGAAISTNASDDPFWKILYNNFLGSETNPSKTIGLALSGFPDGVVIDGNDFGGFQIGIKLGANAGANAHLANNSFSQGQAGTQRANIWIVPAPTTNNAGFGYTDLSSRHGNENLSATDFAYLYADEGAGTYFGDRLPSFSPSVGYVIGHTITNQMIEGNSLTPTRPLLYSTTPNIQGCIYSEVNCSGTPPTYILQLANPSIPDNPYNRTNIIGPVTLITAGTSAFQFCNTAGFAEYVDPLNVNLLGDLNKELQIPGTAGTGYCLNLLTASISGFSTSSATISAGVDADGGADAATVNFTATQGLIYSALAAPASFSGEPIYIEFDISPVAASPLTGLSIYIQETTGYVVTPLATIPIPTARRHVAMKFEPRIAGGTSNYILGFGDSTQIGTGSVLIGKLRVYQSSNRASGNIHKGPQFIEESLSTPATPTGGGYLWVDASGNLKYVSPGAKTTTIATNT